jgi:uncharacterized protein (TIGR04255 family)
MKMGTPLKNPPVYFTVASVQFNTLLKLVDYLPSIQEGMRKNGFPDFAARRMMQVQVTSQNNAAAPVPTTSAIDLFAFGSLDRTHRFVIGIAGLTLFSTRYGHFKAFSDTFIKGLALVHEIVDLNFSERVGLRYLDQVAPRQGDDLDQYLAPGVLGLRDRLGGDAVHTFTECLTRFETIQLRSRVIVQNSPLALPPDLLTEGDMQIERRFGSYAGLHAILDTDSFVEARHVFSAGAIKDQLHSIHEVISEAFKTIVTDHARDVWDQ